MFRPVIVGCRTDDFSTDELAAFRSLKPFGMTLFDEPARRGKQAIRHVVRQFREATGRPDAPVFVDQEGGRVNRLKASFGHGWRDIPPAADFAMLAMRDPAVACEAAFVNAQLIACDMREVDLHVDYAPVLDLFSDTTFRGGREGLHAASGDLKARMLGSDPALVTTLGRAFCAGLVNQGVVPVLKHLPGYGRVQADPHYTVTRVDASVEELDRHDFRPFRELSDMPAAMLAHVVYTAIDPDWSATLSLKVIELVRSRIGFRNALITDAIEMSAVWPGAFSADIGLDQFGMALPKPGMIGEITRLALGAGCDLILHGNNSRDFAHTVEMMEAALPCEQAQSDRLSRLFQAPASRTFDRAAALRRLDVLLNLPQE